MADQLPSNLYKELAFLSFGDSLIVLQLCFACPFSFSFSEESTATVADDDAYRHACHSLNGCKITQLRGPISVLYAPSPFLSFQDADSLTTPTIKLGFRCRLVTWLRVNLTCNYVNKSLITKIKILLMGRIHMALLV